MLTKNGLKNRTSMGDGCQNVGMEVRITCGTNTHGQKPIFGNEMNGTESIVTRDQVLH